MENLFLRERLINFFKKTPKKWFSSGDIQRMVAQKTEYTPSNVSRRLRELQGEYILDVEYRKGHAWYRYSCHNVNKVSQGLLFEDV